MFGKSSMATRAVKYIWSRVVPVGTTLGSSRARAIVLRTGAPPDDEWVTETVNVRRDYERLYGEAPGKARGVAVLTDADQTRSRAVGDYGPFRVCPDGLVAPSTRAAPAEWPLSRCGRSGPCRRPLAL